MERRFGRSRILGCCDCFDIKVVSQRSIDNSHFFESKNLYKLQYTIHAYSPDAIAKSSRPDVFCEKGVLRNSAKFTGKHLCQSLFFNKVAGGALRKLRIWSYLLKKSLMENFLCSVLLNRCAANDYCKTSALNSLP